MKRAAQVLSSTLLAFYALPLTAIFTVSLIDLPKSWVGSKAEQGASTVYYWLMIVLTLPLLYASFRSAYNERAAVSARKTDIEGACNLRKRATALIKITAPAVSVYHLLSPTPFLVRILLAGCSMAGGSYLFFNLFKRSDQVAEVSRANREWFVNFMAAGLAASEFIFQTNILLKVGYDFQEDIIHPAHDAINGLIFSIIILAEMLLFIQNMTSFRKRIRGIESFDLRNGSALAHYCSAVKTLAIISSFLLLPRQLSNGSLTVGQSVLIGIIPAAVCAPGFYGCIYSFFGNNQLRKADPYLPIMVKSHAAKDSIAAAPTIETNTGIEQAEQSGQFQLLVDQQEGSGQSAASLSHK